MLHGWTEYDTIRIEQNLLDRRLDAVAEHLGFNDNTTQHASVIVGARRVLAAAMVALAGRIAPTGPIDQPQRGVASV